MSERVVWAPCPRCEQPAAVGLAGDAVVEFDCPAGCDLTHEELTALRGRFRTAE